MKHIKLFCLPYAGGSTFMYNSILKNVNEMIEVIPVEYAGHGERIGEDFYKDFKEMIIDVSKKIINQIQDTPFAILGYSMGSLVAYEVYYNILKITGKRPKHIFFATHGVPDQTEGKRLLEKLSYNYVKNRLLSIGGIDDDILDDEELLKEISQSFYADVRLYASYEYKMKTETILSNITIIYSDDEEKNGKIKEWSNFTSKFCYFCKIKGNHYFINTDTYEFTKIINKTLLLELTMNKAG